VSPNTACSIPEAIIRKIPNMNAYVGIANAVPDSRTPRRFIRVSTTTSTTARATLCGASAVTAEVRFATPAETDTATVST
jgi:hypothetical protein